MSDTKRSGLRIFLVDDHPAIRQALRLLFMGAGHQVCGEAANIKTTLDRLSGARPDLVVIDLSLKEESGMDLLDELRSRGIGVIVYSMHEDVDIIQRSFAHGAAGYVTKRDDISALLEAVDKLGSEDRYASPGAAQALVRRLASKDRGRQGTLLSDREREIMRLLAEGASGAEIGASLGVSVRTVESYCARIMGKLRVKGMKDLRKYAISRKDGYKL